MPFSVCCFAELNSTWESLNKTAKFKKEEATSHYVITEIVRLQKRHSPVTFIYLFKMYLFFLGIVSLFYEQSSNATVCQSFHKRKKTSIMM